MFKHWLNDVLLHLAHVSLHDWLKKVTGWVRLWGISMKHTEDDSQEAIKFPSLLPSFPMLLKKAILLQAHLQLKTFKKAITAQLKAQRHLPFAFKLDQPCKAQSQTFQGSLKVETFVSRIRLAYVKCGWENCRLCSVFKTDLPEKKKQNRPGYFKTSSEKRNLRNNNVTQKDSFRSKHFPAGLQE